MIKNFNIRSEEMPSEMQLLLSQYPRDSWDAHPGFKDRTRHWLGAHQMFKRLAQLVRTDAESYLDKSLSLEKLSGRLSYYGGALVGNLHGHHGWEDREYFPELLAADNRFEAGLEVLEKDHEELDVVLDSFENIGAAVLNHSDKDEKEVSEEIRKLRDVTEVIELFLKRHLTDEEELAVPIILHHRLRG